MPRVQGDDGITIQDLDLPRPSSGDSVRRDATTSRRPRVFPILNAGGIEKEARNEPGERNQNGSGREGEQSSCCSVKGAAQAVWPHLKLVILNMAYLGFGAWVFCALECEGQKARQPKVPAHRQVILDNLWAAANSTINFKNWTTTAQLEMTNHEDIVIRARDEHVWGTNGSSPAYLSDPIRAMFFAAVVVTTIGYGHVTPQTTGGRVFLIFYAIFGMPLMLAWQADINRLLGKFLHFMAEKINSVVRPDLQAQEARRIPAWAMRLSLVLYLLVGAGVVCFWEEWTFVDSLYFTYITVSTTGFGDLIPSKQLYVIIVFPYILLGLSFVSTCFRMTQETLLKLDARFCGGRKRQKREACPCCGRLVVDMKPEDLVLVRKMALRWQRKTTQQTSTQHRLTQEKPRRRKGEAVFQLLPVWTALNVFEDDVKN